MTARIDESSDVRRPRKAELFLALPPHPSSHREARWMLERFLAAASPPASDEQLTNFLIAVGEALSNAIEHSATCNFIEIAATLAEHRAVVEIRDRGKGFRVRPAGLPDMESERGRGLPLMRLCTDDLQIWSEPLRGTVVRLVSSY